MWVTKYDAGAVLEPPASVAPKHRRLEMHSNSTLPPNDPALAERFWSKVDKGPSCWLWTRARDHRGYGIFSIASRNQVASRVAWMLTHGPIPDGLNVLHRCDTPSCVNPDHLFIGTQRDNLQDMDSKGRRGIHHPAGEKNPKAKLTSQDVQEIRQTYRRYSREFGSTALARKYGVAHSTIWLVLNGRTWNETEGAES